MKIFQKIKKGETRILKFCGITVFIYKKKRKHIRYAFKEVGSFVDIGKGSRISHSENIILKSNIHIGEGAVVAMGSVVVKDISKGAVVGGNPAKILKYRDLAQYDKLCSEESFYNFCGEKVNRILIKN